MFIKCSSPRKNCLETRHMHTKLYDEDTRESEVHVSTAHTATPRSPDHSALRSHCPPERFQRDAVPPKLRVGTAEVDLRRDLARSGVARFRSRSCLAVQGALGIGGGGVWFGMHVVKR